MILRVGAAALLAATLIVPVARAAAATGTQIQRGIASAVAYGHAEGVRVAVAVEDLKTGRTWTGGVAGERFTSASVVKTMIATRALLNNRVHGAVLKQAWSMITRSDNDAASSLGQSADLGSPAPLKPVRPLLGRLGSVRT